MTETSVSQFDENWHLIKPDARQSLALQQQFQIPAILADLLAGRGFTTETVERFLNPKLKLELPDPSRFKDMDKAVKRIADAIINRQKIAIFGDYDVDGATSTSLWLRFLEQVGCPASFHIPDRIEEGYGPNAPALLALQKQGAQLILTVDCGISAFNALDAAADANLDVIVLDHHQSTTQLPKAVAVVNPNRFDEEMTEFGHLAAVGVCFLTIIAVNRYLRDHGFYTQTKLEEPDLLNFLDLVALGTVCDVVKLTGLNRAFVSQGLKIMARRENHGLTALMDCAEISEAPTTYHCGFVLGPRVNAGGRVGDSSLGTRLLSEAAPKVNFAHYASTLDLYNEERKEIEQACLDEAMEQLASEHDDEAHDWAIFAIGKDWHSGVIGIVAGRLKEKFHRPSIVITIDEHGIGKGSARSIEGVDIGALIGRARDQGMLINGGGHKMAAGLTIEIGKLAEFRTFVLDEIRNLLKATPPSRILKCEGIIQIRAATLELCETLQTLAPFGVGNPEPRFILYPARVTYARVVGKDHIRANLAGEDGGSLQAIAFRALDTDYGQTLLKAGANSGSPLFAIAGRLRTNQWQGTVSPQFQIEAVTKGFT